MMKKDALENTWEQEKDILKSLIKIYKTFNPDEFLRVNCFICCSKNLKLSPEYCFLFIYLGRCVRDCKNNLVYSYTNVFLRRIKERAGDSCTLEVDEETLLDCFFDLMKSTLKSEGKFDEESFRDAVNFVKTGKRSEIDELIREKLKL